MAKNTAPRADLNAIRAPDQPLSDQPDQKTSDEATSYVQKPLTAGERAEEKDRLFIASLQAQIIFHKDECERARGNHSTAAELFKQEIDELQAELAGKQQRIEQFIEERTELRTAAKSSSCLTMLVTLFTAGGGGVVSFAGTLPGLEDHTKQWLTCAGTGVVVCALIVGAAAWYLTPSSKRTVQHPPSEPRFPAKQPPAIAPAKPVAEPPTPA